MEVELATLLIRHCLAEQCTEEAVKAALAHRMQVEEPNKEFRLGEGLQQRPADAESDAEAEEGMREDDSVLIAWEAARLQRLARAEEAFGHVDVLKSHWDQFLSDHGGVVQGAAASSSSSSSGPGAPARRFNPIECKSWSATEARKLLPPKGFTISKDLRENRWRLGSRFVLEGQCSKSYGRNSVGDDYQALHFLLRLAWRAWHRHSGEECPYNLEDAGVQVLG